MTSDIRPAAERDIREILSVYAEARAFMAANGNPSQWGPSGYPREELLREDIALKRLYVIERRGVIAAAFVLFEGDEPTYKIIEGTWLSDAPYMTIHRLGSRTGEHGTARECLDFASALCRKKGLDLRADTHADNKPMLHILEKNGFVFCGIIKVADGTPRRAFQKNI